MKTLFFEESFSLFVAILLILLVCVLAYPYFKKYAIIAISFVLIILAFLIYFYRYPTLVFHPNPTAVFAPSDGVVKQVIYDEKNKRIKVVAFLNIFDQHVQFYPVSGKIAAVTYHPGEFHPAYFLEKSAYNERMETAIKTDRDTIVVTQIAGQIARRIVNHSKINTPVSQGEYMGMIKLSSRVDIEFSSTIYDCKVKIGDKLTALETIIAVEK
ncbi:phosphatidylserine decarboxylase [Dishui Lake large algae virus 1]|nr:phosphatidylserine decarboxylase [Dishui Lake large algae virus 1]